MVVAPHPDDLEIFCGGTVAEHIKKGDEVVELLVTDGQLGSLKNMLLGMLPGRLKGPDWGLGKRRREEAVRSAAFLKIQLKALGLVDRGVKCEHAELIQEAVRAERPELVYAPDPEFASYRHPDHLEVGRAVSGFRPVRFYHTSKPNLRFRVDKKIKVRAVRFHRSQWWVWGIFFRRRIGDWEEFREIP